MRKTVTVIQRIAFVIAVLFLVSLGVQIVDKDIAKRVLYATLVVYYGSEAIALYYEAHKYKTEKEGLPVEFLTHQAFKSSLDFVDYKRTNHILLERAEMWQLRHDKAQKRYMRQDAAFHLFVALLSLIGLLQ